MAASRSKRSNAGARMAEVMENDARDPFYASVYGGFYDEATDEDYKCTARAPPRNKKEEDGSGPSVQKEDEAEVEDGASEEGSDVEADSDADDGAEEYEEKADEAVETETVVEQENETKSVNENETKSVNKNETKSMNKNGSDANSISANGKTELSKTIEEPSPKRVKLSETES